MLGQRTLLYKGWIEISDIPRCCDTDSVKTIVHRDNKVFIFKDEQPEARAWRQRLPPLIEKLIQGLPPFYFVEYSSTAYTFTLVHGP